LDSVGFLSAALGFGSALTLQVLLLEGFRAKTQTRGAINIKYLILQSNAKLYTKWDDLPFIIHYYLSDDTVEIREVHTPNDGRDNFALLLKRRKIPYSFNVSLPGLSFMGDNYLTYNEIVPGGHIHSYGRDFYI
jgi:hypothetical protein